MARKLPLLCVFAALLSAHPAAAESVADVVKAEAILGGPSKLAALVAQQSGQGPAPTLASALPQPSSRGQMTFSRRVGATSAAVSRDRPDVFGTIALRVQHTPLDRRWKRAQQGRVHGALARWASALAGAGLEQRIDAVNQLVNARVRFVDDIRQYGAADVWQSAGDTLRRGRGDCEDYAIAKLQLLRQAGVSPDDLYLVIVKDLVRRADHAVLVVRADNRLLLLDNSTDRLADATAYQDYRPMLSYAATGRAAWTHGYERTRLAVAAGPATATASALR